MNVTGAKNIPEPSELGTKAVYASRSSVYDNPQFTLIREDTPHSPENPYGTTKTDTWAVAQEYVRGRAASRTALL